MIIVPKFLFLVLAQKISIQLKLALLILIRLIDHLPFAYPLKSGKILVYHFSVENYVQLKFKVLKYSIGMRQSQQYTLKPPSV